jgi:excisionase family DNA binding protein
VITPKLAVGRTEAAELACTSLTNIDRAIRVGELPAKRPTPRTVLILVSELQKWLEQLPDA